jgi:hypothetical protein
MPAFTSPWLTLTLSELHQLKSGVFIGSAQNLHDTSIAIREGEAYHHIPPHSQAAADGLIEGRTADTNAERRYVMFALRKEISAFATASETLLGHEIIPAHLSEEEGQMIQYYLSTLAVKFPALSN